MARLKGPLLITGTLGDISFYKFKDIIVARRKWGPDRKRIQRDGSFWRMKAHSLEFGQCAKDSSALRGCLRQFLLYASDTSVTGRTNKLMNAIKNCDTISPPGELRVYKAIHTPEAAVLLNGFDFNKDAPLKKLLKAEVVVKDGVVNLTAKPDGKTKTGISFPKGATQAEIHCGHLRIDFKERKGELIASNKLVLTRKDVLKDCCFDFAASPALAGIDIFALCVIFYKPTSEGLVMLPKEMNGCGVIGVTRIENED